MYTCTTHRQTHTHIYVRCYALQNTPVTNKACLRFAHQRDSWRTPPPHIVRLASLTLALLNPNPNLSGGEVVLCAQTVAASKCHLSKHEESEFKVHE